jgi:predicted TIM-barrel fold metal-dependent hydrolase
MKIVDADAHIAIRGNESVDLISRTIKRWPDQISVRTDGILGVVIEGRPYPQVTGPGTGPHPDHGFMHRTDADPFHVTGVLADADRDGIDEMVLYPGFGNFALSVVGRDLATGIARMYNEWVAAYCSAAPDRLHGVAVIPIDFPDDAASIVREAKQFGLVAGVVPPAPRTANLDATAFEPVYAAAEDSGLPLAAHGAPGMYLPMLGSDRFDIHLQVHAVSFPFDQMVAMTALVTGGVFERHPGLRMGLLEAGAGWVPYFVERLHGHYVRRGDWIPGGWKRPPEDYISGGNLYVTCEPDEEMLPAVIAALGPDFIMYASDYPHWDSDWPESTKPLRTRQDISDGDREKLLSGNARRFYGL